MNNAIEQLKKLKSVSPSGEALERGHYFLMARLDSKLAEKSQLGDILCESYTVRVMRDARSAVKAFVRIYVSHIALSLAVVTLFFAGFGALATYYSQDAVDGPQYVLKRALENAHIALSSSDRRTVLRVEQLGQRVEESQKIVQKVIQNTEEGSDKIIEAIQKAQSQAIVVREDIESVSLDDGVSDIDMKDIQNRLTSYSIALDGFEEELPEDIKEEVQKEVEELAQTIDAINRLVTTKDIDNVDSEDGDTQSGDDIDGLQGTNQATSTVSEELGESTDGDGAVLPDANDSADSMEEDEADVTDYVETDESVADEDVQSDEELSDTDVLDGS